MGGGGEREREREKERESTPSQIITFDTGNQRLSMHDCLICDGMGEKEGVGDRLSACLYPWT